MKIPPRFHEVFSGVTNHHPQFSRNLTLNHPEAMSNMQMSAKQSDPDKHKRQLQQKKQLQHNWAVYQAQQQATQLGLTTTHLGHRNNFDSFDQDIFATLQKIWMRRGTFAPPNLANVFLQQTEHLSFADYKKALVQYLWTAIADEPNLEPLKQKVEETLAQLWTEQNDKTVDSGLRLRTCNRLISLITTQGNPYPSSMFTLLAMQKQYDILGLMLLRLMLLSRSSYKCYADAVDVLMDYYTNLKTPKSKWIVNFLEVFKMNITDYLDRDFAHKIDFKPRNSIPNL